MRKMRTNHSHLRIKVHSQIILFVTYKALGYVCGIQALEVLERHPGSKDHISCIEDVSHILHDRGKGEHSSRNIKAKSYNFHREDNLGP